jgi:hypothetical protein
MTTDLLSLSSLHTRTHPLHQYLSSVGFHFIYFCRISYPAASSTNSYGVLAGSFDGSIKVAEFAAGLEANSTLAVGNSAVEQLRGAFRTIDEEVLKELAELQYCPEEFKLDLDVSASRSAHGENDKICNNRGAPVLATLRPSLQASVGQSVTNNETIGASLVALAALAAFIALVVLVVSGLKVVLLRRIGEFSCWNVWRHL